MRETSMQRLTGSAGAERVRLSGGKRLMRSDHAVQVLHAIKRRSLSSLAGLRVRGATVLFALAAFYSALTAAYFAAGIYRLTEPADKDDLFGEPIPAILAGKLLLAVSGSLVAAGVLTACRRSRRAAVAAACAAGAFLLFAASFAGYQQYFLRDEIPLAAVLLAGSPAIALLIWTVVSAERHARLFSAWSAWTDRAFLILSRRRLLGRTLVFWIVAATGLLTMAGYIVLAVNQYWRLTPHYDTAAFENVFFHTLRGRIGWESLDRVNHLGVHFTPTLGLLLPVYAAFPHAVTLLILESVFLVLGGIPLWWLAVRTTGSPRAAYVFTVAYVTFPHIIGTNIHGFNVRCLWPLMGFTYLWFIERPGFERRAAFWGVLLLTLGLTEEFALTLAAVSLVHWLQGRSRAGHAAVIAVCAVWFLTLTHGLMPALLGPAGHPEYGKGWLFANYYRDMVPEGTKALSSYAANAFLHPSLTAQMLTRPQVLKFLLDISLPLLFLPWLSGMHLLALVPSLLLTHALASRHYMVSTLSSYITYVVPWFYCALYGWMRVRERFAKGKSFGQTGFLYAVLAISLLGLTQSVRLPLPVTPEDTHLRQWLESRPVELRVMATRCFLSYLAGRDTIRSIDPEDDLSQLDLVIVQSTQRYCTWTMDGFPAVKKAVAANGDFAADPSPMPGIVVYRRVRPAP
ncbi:MAG: DUF2079 domain-containing protein [SAR324 cluster bacterium]